MALALPWCLMYGRHGSSLKFGTLLTAAGIFCCAYIVFNQELLSEQYGYISSMWQTGVAILLLTIVLEMARRSIGWPLPCVALIALCYGLFGQYIPGEFGHPGLPLNSFLGTMTIAEGGIWGKLTGVSVNVVAIFVIFGAVLNAGEAGQGFMNLATAAAGHLKAGVAKVSVLSSALFGSISGSAIANTVSTGMFTIPMMKKAGFRPHVAGGIEPAASIGGMFMPPIMGAGGFIMAELTGVPYSKIMLVAIFPAVMYFFSVFCMVHYEAKKYNIVGEKSKVSAMEIFKKEWFYALPLVVITIFMLTGYSPGYSAILGLVSCVYISWADKEKRMDLTMAIIVSAIFLVSLINIVNGGTEDIVPQWAGFLVGILAAGAFYLKFPKQAKPGLSKFLGAARSGTENSLKIGATVGVIGIIIGVLTFSGLVLTFADIMIELAGGSLLLTIFLVALASLVLGMGVPVTAAYLITAVVAVPALTHLGVNEIAAHMIVYWLSQDSNITPPVCIAAFAGATIAKANMWKTAFTSFKFAKFLYLGPILFGYVPGFSLNGSSTDIIKAFVLILFGTWAYSWFLSGIWMNYIKAFFKKSPT